MERQRRDEFPLSVKRLLAQRVNYVCSNPKCMKFTSGPHSNPHRTNLTGKASHITAAASRGPRFNPGLTPDERKSPDNGIWLCATCADLVDNDEDTYPVELLNNWKAQTEIFIKTAQENNLSLGLRDDDTYSTGILTQQLDSVAATLSKITEDELETMRESLREGHADKVLDWQQSVEDDQVRWNALFPEVKGKILRLKAILELDLMKDINRAAHFVSEARQLAPDEAYTPILALIAKEEHGIQNAVELLEYAKDIDSINLRAALALEVGDISQCRSILEHLDTHVVDADSLRLLAMAHLASQQIDEAQLNIHKALELNPNWFSLRFWGAVINYFSVHFTFALPDHLLPYPVPIVISGLRRDEQALTRLRQAADTLDKLLNDSISRYTNKDQLRAWYLGCLANDPDRQEDAKDYCDLLLSEEPMNYFAIDWCIAREFEIDLSNSESALRDKIFQSTATATDIRCLVMILLISDRSEGAIELLEEHRDIFKEHEEAMMWTYWYCQSIAKSGKPATAVQVLEESEFESELQEFKTMALNQLASTTNDWEPLSCHLEDLYQSTNDPAVLLKLCQLNAHRDKWSSIVPHIDSLLDHFGSPEVYNLAATTLYNTHQYAQCLNTIEESLSLFYEGILPNQLKQLRILCNKELGNFPSAIYEAEEAVSNQPTTNNILILARLLHDKGDIRGVAAQANRLTAHSDLQPNQALQLAFWIKNEDRFLAADLWRLALSQGIEDDLVSSALVLGMQLGLGIETRPLISRLASLARDGKGGVKTFSMQEVSQWMREQNEFSKEFYKAYRHGLGPINLGSYRFSWNLAHFYHVLLADNESSPDPLYQYSLLIRHGNRGMLPSYSEETPDWHLHPDITSILLAEHFGILEKIENSLGPIHIPNSIPLALTKMEHHLAHHQPEYLVIYQHILDLIDAGELHVVDTEPPSNSRDDTLANEIGEDRSTLLELAISHNGYLADYLPLCRKGPDGFPSGDPPTSLPSIANNHLVNCKSLLNALLDEGAIPSQTYNVSLAKLGAEGQNPIDAVRPVTKRHIYCYGNIPELIADAGYLRIAAFKYTLFIEKEEVDRIKAALALNRDNRTTKEWVANLRVRISNGIDSGKYQIIPEPSPGDTKASIGADDDFDIQSNITLMRFTAQENDVIWVDDRFFSMRTHRVGAPIIGINEVLNLLLVKGIVTTQKYYDVLYKMRAANLRFIPLEKDEILYHLKNAQLDEQGKVIETAELAVLRRSFSAALLDKETLQRATVEDGSNVNRGEIDFLLSNSHAITEALLDLWNQEPIDVSEAIAKSDWIRNNLYLDSLSLLSAASMAEEKHEPRYMVSLSLAGLIGRAIGLNSEQSGESASIRNAYLNWLHDQILGAKFDSDPNLIISTSDHLKRLVLDIATEKISGDFPEGVIIRSLQDFYIDLPDEIKLELQKDLNFMEQIGWSIKNITNIGNYSFEREAFVEAAHEAINGREAKLNADNLNLEVVFKPSSSLKTNVFTIVESESSKVSRVTIKDFLLLKDPISERETLLRNNRHWFDLSSEALDSAIAEIITTESLSERIDLLKRSQDSSASFFYLNLFNRIKRKHPFKLAELFPNDPTILLHNLRLSLNIGTGDDFIDSVARSSQLLIDDEGVRDTIDRLGGLPIPLPSPMIQHIEEMKVNDRRDLFRDLIKMAGSPVSKFHLISIMRRFTDDNPAYPRFINRITMELFTPQGTGQIEAFLSILKRVQEEHGLNMRFKDFAPQVKLAIVWSHAHRLHSLFSSIGASSDWIQQVFNTPSYELPSELYHRDIGYGTDISHPRNVDSKTFLVSGLAYCRPFDLPIEDDHWARKIIRGLAFPYSDHPDFPDASLSFDPTSAKNHLGAFLGEDRGTQLAFFLNSADSKQYQQETLQAKLEQALQALEKSAADLNAWLMIHCITRGQPLYPEFQDRFLSIVSNTDFDAIISKDLEQNTFILLVVSLQLFLYGNDSARESFWSQLIRIVQSFIKQLDGQSPQQIEEMGQVLLDPLMNISFDVDSVSTTISNFVQSIDELLEISPDLMKGTYSTLIRLWEELPVEYAHYFTPLIVRIRALL